MWSGYMQNVCEGDHAAVNTVHMLPIIDLSPSDMSCIYSTLLFVSEQAKFLGLTTPCITFDQPLYIKAVDIVAADKLNIVVRLGGFHTLMNFMGAVGSIMRGSGLEEVFELLYGTKTLEHVMTGKAYVRAIHGHMIVHSALTNMLLQRLMPDANSETVDSVAAHEPIEDLILTHTDVQKLQSLYRSVNEHKVCISQSSIDSEHDVVNQHVAADNICCHDSLNKLHSSYHELCLLMSEQSRTARLWVLYSKYVQLMQQFLIAERTSNWSMHLQCIRRMLDLFAAANHVHYAKCGRVYLQQMCELEHTHPWLHDQFLAGMHTIRKSDRFWAGLSCDLVIEQDMMAAVKGKGGLTHGRGMNETTRITWLNTLTECAAIGSATRKLTGDHRHDIEHVELTSARVQRDGRDIERVQSFFIQNSPFHFADTDCLVSLSTGVTARPADNVTCDIADKIGANIMKKLDDAQYCMVSLKKCDTVKTLASMHSVFKFTDDNAEIDANKLFQRLVVVAHTDRSTDVSSAFQYELTAYPTSIFRDGLMRKPDKPNLFKTNLCGITTGTVPSDAIYVVDGGCLLR